MTLTDTDSIRSSQRMKKDYAQYSKVTLIIVIYSNEYIQYTPQLD